MSKSKNNTIEPSSLIEKGYGADSVRLMELFIGPWNQAVSWSVEGIGGTFRFLQRVWTLVQEYQETPTSYNDSAEPKSFDLIKPLINKTIKKVSHDLENLNFNTAIAALMECLNELYKLKEQNHYADRSLWEETIKSFLKLLAPFAPHMSEELWQQMGEEGSIHISHWPVYNEKYLVQAKVALAVQINGKLRGEIEIDKDATEDAVVAAAKKQDKVAGYLKDRVVRQTIYVKGKIVNFVI